jgi:hypothetical protein
MSYEKYIKYKTKYLNLKAKIHNEKIQIGGGINNTMNENDFIQTLGSTPNSEIYIKQINLFGGAKESEELTNKLPDKLSSSESVSDKDSSDNNLPEHLSSSESSSSSKSSSENSNKTSTIEEKLVGGARKIKKNKNVFSESELNESESSLLSFSSVESDSSSDNY